jgi:hypothetical protein
MAEHYDTILPTRSRKPRDKGKVEGAVLIVERWILARLRHRRFFSVADLNSSIAVLLEDLNSRPMRQVGKSRRQLFEGSNVWRWRRCRVCRSTMPNGNRPRSIPTITLTSIRPSTRCRID